jgi:hypothetical protein
MEQTFQTSFIPQKPIVKERATSSRPISFFMIIALFILFTVLLATGGLYFYKGINEKKIVSMENTLNLARNRFEPAKIAELQVLDKRLNAATEVLGKHMVITPIFKSLEQLTMKTVRYTKFDYGFGEGGDALVRVKISGQAIGYRSIALQSDLFATNKNIIDPVFSNLTLDTSGNVLFDLEFSVEPNFANYKQTFLTES